MHSEQELRQLGQLASSQARRFGFSPSDADDVSQLVLIDLITAKEPVHTPRAWVRKVALRKAWKLKQRHALAAEHQVAENAHFEQPDLGVRVDLARHFSLLPASDAELWVRRRLERRSLAELVERDIASASTIKRRLTRTTERLQRSLLR